MRTRVSDARIPTVRNWYSFDWEGKPQHKYDSIGSGQPSGTVSTMTDVVNPNFRERMRRGEIILSPMSLSRITQGGGECSLRIAPTGGWGVIQFEGEWTTAFSGSVDYGLPAVMSMSDQALIKAYAKMNSSPILIGETLLDLDKTFDMFKSPFKRSRELLIQMNKYRLRRLGKTTASAMRAASSAWLEYRYGWKPVIIDCESAAKMIRQKAVHRDRKILVARASTSQSYSNSVMLAGTRGFGFDVKYSGAARCAYTGAYHAGVLYRATQASVESLSTKLGYRPSDLAATFWERIPYSFVVDWFVNVGDWIQAVVPVPGIEILGNWVTSVANTEETVGPLSLSGTVFSDNRNQTFTGTSETFTRTTVNVSRGVNLPLPSGPSLTRKPLSTLHRMDAASLACNSLIADLKSFASHLRRR